MKACACGAKPRYVINGNSERLSYWYCDACKAEPKESKPSLLMQIAEAYMNVLAGPTPPPSGFAPHHDQRLYTPDGELTVQASPFICYFQAGGGIIQHSMAYGGEYCSCGMHSYRSVMNLIANSSYSKPPTP